MDSLTVSARSPVSGSSGKDGPRYAMGGSDASNSALRSEDTLNAGNRSVLNCGEGELFDKDASAHGKELPVAEAGGNTPTLPTATAS